MNEDTQAELEASPAEETEVEETSAPSQEESNPVQEELDKVEASKRTKKEKLEYTKARVEKQLAELEGNSEDDNRPLTVREFRALQADEAKQTAMTLAEEIEDDAERKLTMHHLENTIKPSGDVQTDLRNARLLVNAVKNRQLAEESSRAAKVRTAPSAPAAPPRQKNGKAEFSKEESAVINGFGLTEEEALAALK